ncbi:hypothetical protein [Anatilimnocola floriformis]|uniref:hypothetical protein n=1 Tax=Anatilimnocola floriformis TaxID=2948575 RepID=UPI0020C29B12|nr:hypothetical protein [Anatilimnocola floriformis]
MKETKKRSIVLSTTTQCPLNFAELVVYSYCWFRQRKGLPITRIGIERDTGLTRKGLDAAAITNLCNTGLLTVTGNIIKANEPPAHYFHVPKKEKAKFPFCYFSYYVRSTNSELSARMNVLYWRISDNPYQSIATYAGSLGLTWKTVKENLKDLRELGLVAEDNIVAVPPAEALHSLWKDKDIPKAKPVQRAAESHERDDRESSVATATATMVKAKAKPKPVTAKPQTAAADRDYSQTAIEAFEIPTVFELEEYEAHKDGEAFRRKVNLIGNRLRECNYTDDDVAEVLQAMVTISGVRGFYRTEEFIGLSLSDLITQAESKSATNRAGGKFGGRNSKGILISMIKEWLPIQNLARGRGAPCWRYCEVIQIE